jgi:CRISPR-associated protein Cmr2
MTNHLFLFTIGPVQSFIAQARKTRDLYSGSQILNDLVWMGIQTFQDVFPDGEIIFPFTKRVINKDSLPNRFIAKVSADISELDTKGKDIQSAVRARWIGIAKESLRESMENVEWTNAVEAQISGLLDIHWVFQEIDDRSSLPYAAAYEKIERMGGAIKNIRQFTQYQYNGYGEIGRKCSVDGINNLLFYKKKSKEDKIPNNAQEVYSFMLNPGEGLSAVSFTKRFYKQNDIDKFPSTSEVALLEDFKNIPDGLRECYKNLFSQSNSDIIKACQDIIKNGWQDKIRLVNPMVKDWNNQFDAHYYFKENLNIRNIPNEEQLELLKQLHGSIEPYLKTRYYAVILFDGDYMGKWLSGENIRDRANLEVFHKNLSESLGAFAKYAKDYLDLKNGNGKTVYAGGDDFLGFVNIHHLFPVMRHLREKFYELVNQPLIEYKKTGEDLTFSAGIVIAHYKTPFSEVLKKAREVEKAAKRQGDRNAFGIAVMKHSGEIQQAVYKWDGDENSASGCSNWGALEHIYNELSNDGGHFSNKFIQSLTSEITGLSGVSMADFFSSRNGRRLQEKIIPVEIKRLIGKSLKEQENKDENIIDQVTKSATQLWDKAFCLDENSPQNFIHTLHIADFMTRKTNQ